jgi:transposase-like protein
LARTRTAGGQSGFFLVRSGRSQGKQTAGSGWRTDETYIKVKGTWKYLYRAVDKEGHTADFLLTAKRNIAAVKRFFDKAMRHNRREKKSWQLSKPNWWQ